MSRVRVLPLLALAGCLGPSPEAADADPRARAAQLAEKNAAAIAALTPGMPRSDVYAAMPAGVVGERRRFPSLANPGAHDTFERAGATPVEVDYYLVEGWPYCRPGGRDHPYEPLVFVDGRLAGVGWQYMAEQREAWGVRRHRWESTRRFCRHPHRREL